MPDDAEVRVEYLALQVILLLAAKPPRDRDKQVGALDLAYGNLATSSVYGPSRKTFHTLATDRYGWSNNEFNEWADAPLRTTWLP